MTVGIYKITNKINEKIYVGQSVHIERRWQEHCQPKNKSAIAQAIRKYGKENFEFEILEVCDPRFLDIREEFYIHKLNTVTPCGYNINSSIDGRKTSFSIYNQKEFNNIINDIKARKSTIKSIAEKYNLTQMTIIRLNTGESHYNPNEDYPLRPLKEGRKIYLCVDCGKEISYKSKRCNECHSLSQKKAERPAPLDLADLVVRRGFAGTGELFGVSGNTIKKWCKSYGIPHMLAELTLWYREQNGVKTVQKQTFRKNFVIIQKDFEGNVLNEFNTCDEAASYLIKNNITDASFQNIKKHISRVAQGRRKSGYGFLWEWKFPKDYSLND